MSDYRIIRTSGTLFDLERAVVALGGCEIHGAPFRDADSREWCQAVTVRATKPGEVRLQEPRKTK